MSIERISEEQDFTRDSSLILIPNSQREQRYHIEVTEKELMEAIGQTVVKLFTLMNQAVPPSPSLTGVIVIQEKAPIKDEALPLSAEATPKQEEIPQAQPSLASSIAPSTELGPEPETVVSSSMEEPFLEQASPTLVEEEVAKEALQEKTSSGLIETAPLASDVAQEETLPEEMIAVQLMAEEAKERDLPESMAFVSREEAVQEEVIPEEMVGAQSIAEESMEREVISEQTIPIPKEEVVLPEASNPLAPMPEQIQQMIQSYVERIRFYADAVAREKRLLASEEKIQFLQQLNSQQIVSALNKNSDSKVERLRTIAQYEREIQQAQQKIAELKLLT